MALVTLYVFAMRVVTDAERATWLWAIALAAVSPVVVVMERKIWAQSVLPMFVAIFWIAWWRRDRAWGAFTWGVVGALLGQVHMSGLFFAAGVFAWELARGRREVTTRPKWGAWLAGSAVGALPMIPWVLYLVRSRSERQNSFDVGELFTPRLWYFGATDALGLGLKSSLGDASFAEFLRAPTIGGVATYGVGALHAVLAGSGIVVAVLAIWRAWGAKRDAVDATGSALRSVWIGYGVVMTLSGALLYRHYLVVTFPFEWVLLASMALAAGTRKVLPVVWGCQVAVTIAFLVYIHVHHGALGDYGIGLRWQTPEDALRDPYR